MASNFKMFVHRNNETIHIKLMGDFDGTSAHQLIDTLRRRSKGAGAVFIHTSNLSQIYPFGCDIFHNNLVQLNGAVAGKLIFTGENADKLTPGERNCRS